MFFLALIPISLVAWFLGILHARYDHRGWPKRAFLVLLAIPVVVELPGLVAFVAAFFMLGFVYDREGSLAALLARLRSILTGKEGKPGQRKKFAYKQQEDTEPRTDSAPDDAATADAQAAYKEELRRQREEELRRARGEG